MEKEIYLDNSATTAVAEEVIQAMEPYWSVQYGNPSSPHLRGVAAEKTVQSCRSQLAQILKVNPEHLYFTASGTEANNLALLGTANAPYFLRKPGHIITAPTEHPSVLNTIEHLHSQGWDVSFLEVGRAGEIDRTELRQQLRADTKIVSIMFVNNELGTIAPIAELGKIIARENQGRRHKIVFHVDAVQALGTIDFDLRNLGVHLMSFSGHKIFGPKGIGLLYAAPGIPLRPFLFGGEQERGLRPGTENVPAIVGLTRAVKLAADQLPTNIGKLQAARQALLEGIEDIPDAVINSPPDGAPHIVNTSFLGVRGEVLVHFLEQKRIYISMGAACTSRRRGASHVLEAIKLPQKLALSAVRLSLAPQISLDQINYVVYSLKETVEEIRNIYI